MGKNNGTHEKAMFEARDLLDKGAGMGEITEKTGLSKKDVTKEKHKMERR